MRHVALIVLSVSILSGCVTPPLTTPSGRAEVYLPNATPVAIKDVIVADMVAKGFSLSQDTQSSLVFVKEIANMMAAAHVRSRYDDRVMERARFTFAPKAGGLRVFVTEELVTNYGSDLERTTPLTGAHVQTQQEYLNQFYQHGIRVNHDLLSSIQQPH